MHSDLRSRESELCAAERQTDPTLLHGFCQSGSIQGLAWDQKAVYIEGWADSRLNAGIFGTAKTIKALRDCVQGKTITQILAIVDKYVQGHPETWNQPAAAEADDALQDSCPDLRRAATGQSNGG
jgi:hypothetical protein